MTEAELRLALAEVSDGDAFMSQYAGMEEAKRRQEEALEYADMLLRVIAAAGFAVVRADQLLWLQQANYHGPQWAAEHPLPERTDGE